MASGGNRVKFVVRVWPQIGMFQWMALNPQVHEQHRLDLVDLKKKEKKKAYHMVGRGERVGLGGAGEK